METSPSGDSRKLLDQLFAGGSMNVQRSSLFDTEPPRATVDFDRVEGMLLGLAIGDSLGNTTEGRLPHERREKHGWVEGYLQNRYAENLCVGIPSDDTQLAFWTLEQLLADGRLHPDHLAQRFAQGRIFGIGNTVREFVYNYSVRHLPWYECGPDSAGNGALMRIAPILIPHLCNPSTLLWADTAVCAMITHNSRASVSACLAFVRVLWDVLQMSQVPQADWWVDAFCTIMAPLEGDARYSPRSPLLAPYEGPVGRYAAKLVGHALTQNLPVVEACRSWHSGAYLLETVPTVLYILSRHGHNPDEAILCAVNNAKDNDTVAAIVGAAVGALHGRSALRQDWIENLSGRTKEDDDGRVFQLLRSARARWG